MNILTDLMQEIPCTVSASEHHWRIVSKYFTHGLEKMLNACSIQVLTLCQ